MYILKCLSEVGTQAVLTILIGFDREEADVLYVGSHLAVAPYTQMGLGEGALGFDDGCVFLPFLAADVHTDITQFLVIAHRGIIHEVDPQL